MTKSEVLAVYGIDLENDPPFLVHDFWVFGPILAVKVFDRPKEDKKSFKKSEYQNYLGNEKKKGDVVHRLHYFAPLSRTDLFLKD